MGLTILPLLCFVALAAYNFNQTYQNKKMLEEMLILTESASASALLVHELQKERGASAGFLGSKGKKFQDILKQQRTESDQKQNTLRQFRQSAQLPPQLENLFSQIDIELNKIPEMRNRVDNFTVTVKEEVAFYTHLNALLLSIMDNAANNNKNASLAISATAIGSFLQYKERAGIERAIMSNVFANDKFTPALLEKFIRLLAEQQAYYDKFKAHANGIQVKTYDNSVTGKAIDEVNDYRKIALTKMQEGNFNVDPTVWFATITQKINLLKSVEVQLLKELYNDNEQLISDNQNNLISLATTILITLFVVLLLTFYIGSQLDKGIEEITTKLNIISNSNDLTVRIEVESGDELGTISSTINQLLCHLQTLVRTIQNTTEQLKNNLDENIEHNLLISSTINNGSDQVTQVVTATTEMNSTAAEIARNAIQAAQETASASSESKHGNDEVEETIMHINHLSHELNSASAVIEKLNNAAMNIGKFLNVIKEISEKTNLLALNAAIEAARAGDSGRGFAVVADEVRSLALQTKDSTTEIETMICELQTSSTAAQQAMSNGIKVVEQSVEDARHTGENISHINAFIQQINLINEQVATASEEQTSVTEEITRNMVNIQDGYNDMQQDYHTVEKCNQAVELLTKELNATISQFKI